MDNCDNCNKLLCYGCPYAEEEEEPEMKLQAELPLLVDKLHCIADMIKAHAIILRKRGIYKDLETRLAWDCLRAVVPTETICEWYDKYKCNDDHISTLAKKALKEVYSIEEDATK